MTPVAGVREPGSTRQVPLGRLLAVFGYGVGITTTCFLAGAVVTWVRFESLAGVGDIAVVSADKAEFVTTGLSAIIGTALVAGVIGVLLLACFVVWTRFRRRPPRIYTRLMSFARTVGVPAYRYVARHPWRAHLLAPLLAMAVAKLVLPGFLAIPLSLVALLSLLAGLVRGLAEVVSRLAEGRGSVARRARIPVFGLLALAFLAFLLVSVVSWMSVAAFTVAAVFAPVFIWRFRTTNGACG